MKEMNFVYPEINMMQTGQRLRRISSEKEFSVKEIQAALGLASNQAVYDWFNGKTLPTLNNLFALSCLFKVPMESMIVSDVKKKNLPEQGGNCLSRIIEYQKRLKECA